MRDMSTEPTPIEIVMGCTHSTMDDLQLLNRRLTGVVGYAPISERKYLDYVRSLAVRLTMVCNSTHIKGGEMNGPDDEDETVEERAEGNEVIDLRDGGEWEQSLPDSND